MESRRAVAAALLLASVLCLIPVSLAWGNDGHFAVCKIAQSRLSDVATEAVKELLPESDGDLASVCSWADQVRFRYRWSAPLHYINTPEVCTYKQSRDCKDENGVKGMCVAGAITNYTTQLLDYSDSSSRSDYNLTEALKFLAHFMGDIHQPLHVGFADDKGGNTIDVHWYTRKQVLHHVWDVNIIETAEQRFYNEDVEGLIDAIKQNISSEWEDEIRSWEVCSSNQTACPDIYASEGIKAACQWAYKDAANGSVLEDEYFDSRLPIVELRLAQAGVRLAATLNRIFGSSSD